MPGAANFNLIIHPQNYYIIVENIAHLYINTHFSTIDSLRLKLKLAPSTILHKSSNNGIDQYYKRHMNPVFNQKYKTTLCRHWQTTGACTIGVKCVFAHGEGELRNPNDPITLNQNILTDAKMLSSFMTTPFGDVAHIEAMVTAQQLDMLRDETQQLKKALKSKDKESEKNTITAAKEYMNKPHFDITSDPMVQKRITTAQMKLMVKEILKLEMHPIIRCKVEICDQLLEADNVDSCTIMLDSIMERPTASDREKKAYELIIDQASQLAIQLIAEEKVKYQRIRKEQQILIRRQQESFQMKSRGY